jgi:predicted membrane channel-forming protein YqfA (hemolysin III family)
MWLQIFKSVSRLAAESRKYFYSREFHREIMNLDKILTDLAGLAVIILGLVSLTEAILQVQLIGQRLPFTQGVMISLFTISFGGVLLTESASKAFQKLRLKSREMMK